MRRTILLTAAVGVLLGACGQAASNKASRPQARVSIQEVMQSQVDAPADVIWGATSTIVDASGTQTFAPKTEEDWLALRHAAVTLLEAPNLLVMRGRPLLRPGAKVEAEGEGWVADSAQIEAAIKKDWRHYERGAWGLQAVAQEVLTAVDRRDVDQLELASGKLLEACHACHSRFWFASDQP
ncbi:MAG: hypothetical protein ABW063_04970 [Caulobacter sp.]